MKHCVEEMELSACETRFRTPSSRGCARVDRRGGKGIRRGGRGASGTRPDAVGDLNLYGLTNFSAASYLATAIPGGEAGSASGFVIVEQVTITSLGTARWLKSRGNTGVSVGYAFYLSAANALNFWVASGAGAAIQSPAYTVTASDVGRVLTLVGWHDGTKVRFMVARSQVGDGTTITGYTPFTYRTVVSGAANDNTANPASGIIYHAGATCLGTPSVAQLQAYTDQVRARGDLPETMDGATVTHRWSAKDELLRAPNPVGRKTYGARRFTTANHYKTAAPGGIAGVATGFSVAIAAIPEQIAGGAQFQIPLNRSVAGSVLQGYQLVIGNFGATAYFEASTGVGTSATTPTTAITASDVGNPLLLVGVHDGAGFLRFYARGEFVGSVAAASYVPYAGAMFIGTRTALDLSVDKASILGFAGAHVVWTPAEIKAMQVELEATGRMPSVPTRTDRLYRFDDAAGPLASVADVISGGDAIGRVGTLELAVYTATAPAAPTQLTDTTTRVQADALLKIGNPSARIIDPTIDGRRTLGAQGFSVANYLQHATTMRGAGVFHVEAHFRIDAAGSSAFRFIAACRDTGQPGWQLGTLTTNASIAFSVSSTIASTTATIALTAADIGQPLIAVAYFDGTVASLLLRRPGSPDTLAVSVALSGGAFAPAALPFTVGRRAGDGLPADNVSIFGVAGGHTLLTLAKAAAIADATERAGRIAAIAETEHLWDLTTDILASGVDAVPAQVLDRVGTDHMTRVGGLAVQANGTWNGLKNWTAADYFASASNLALGSTNGFGFVVAFQIDSQTVTTNPARMLLDAFQSTPSSGGFQLFLSGQNQTLTLRSFTSGAAPTDSPVHTFTGGMVGAVQVVHGFWDPATTKLELYVNAVRLGTGTTMATINPGTGALWIGAHPGIGIACDGVTIFGGAYGLLPFTAGEITTSYNACVAAGDVVGVPTKTTRTWSFKQDIAAAAGGVPGESVDRTGSDHMARAGSGLTLAQRTERVWSYETSPIIKTAGSFSAVNRFETALGTGVVGTAAGVWIGVLFRNLTNSGGRLLAHSNGGAVGWYFGSTVGTVLQFTIVDGGGTNRVSPSSVMAVDGKLRFALGWYNGSTVGLYHNRASAGAGTAVAAGGYKPDFLSLVGNSMGAFAGGGSPNAGVEIVGYMGGESQVPSFAEFLAAEDACIAAEDVRAIPGRTEHLWSAKVRSGTTILDQIGTAHQVAIGAPTIVDIYGRAFAA